MHAKLWIDLDDNVFLRMKDVQDYTRDEAGKSKSLLSIGMGLVDAPSKLALDQLRVESWTNVRLSKEKSALVQNMKLEQMKCRAEMMMEARSDKVSSRRFLSNLSSKIAALNAVVPLPSASATAAISNNEIQESPSSGDLFAPRNPGSAIIPSLSIKLKKSSGLREGSDNTVIMKKTLEQLSRCEAVLLVECVESVVPLMYGLSLTILHLLPNARYYPTVSELTGEKLVAVVTSILIYSALEFGSLLYVHALLRWKFRISALHQLAFILETDWRYLQGILLGWVIIVLGFTLAHYGTHNVILNHPSRKRFHIRVCVDAPPFDKRNDMSRIVTSNLHGCFPLRLHRTSEGASTNSFPLLA
ncbi:hypothetical protein FI667_g11976, partial [Globisporangium splendens]